MNLTNHRHRHYHIFQYLLLFLLLTISFFAFMKSLGIPQKQFQVGIVTAMMYVTWGVAHHLYDRDLNWKIVLEYLAVSLLGLAVLWTILSLTY